MRGSFPFPASAFDLWASADKGGDGLPRRRPQGEGGPGRGQVEARARRASASPPSPTSAFALRATADKGAGGSQRPCPPHPPPLFHRVNRALDSSRSPSCSAIATSPLVKVPPRLASASRTSPSIEREEARIA